jgi:hypothetical protein
MIDFVGTVTDGIDKRIKKGVLFMEKGVKIGGSAAD